MSAYSQLVDISATAAYPTDPQVVIPFQPKSVLIVNEHSATPADVSFDGVNDAGRLTPALLPAVEWSLRSTKIWLKRAAAPVGTLNVRVMAED